LIFKNRLDDLKLINIKPNSEYLRESSKSNALAQRNLWHNNNYSLLLNRQELINGLKRNLWKYELKSMLNGFVTNFNQYKQDLKFK